MKTQMNDPEDLLGFDWPVPENSETVSAADLSQWLNLSPARIHALAREGVIPRHDGRFELRPAILAYVEHLRAGQKGRMTSNPDLAEQKLRLATANAEKVEIANAKARGELLDARQVAHEWRAVVVDLRAAVLAIPSRVTARLGLDRKATQALDAEIRDAMETIADDR